MSKFVSGVNLTGHPLIIFQAITFLHSHPEIPIQARKNALFDVFSELHGMYHEGKYKDTLEKLQADFKDFQNGCINQIDGDQYSSTVINDQRVKLDEIQLKLKGFIVELKILNEARMGIVSEPTW